MTLSVRHRLVAAVGLFLFLAVGLPAEEGASAPKRPGVLGIALTYHRQGDGGLLLVRGVEPGGPAEKAGVRQQDVITKINGREPKFKDDLALLEYVGKILPGQTVTLGVRRGTSDLTISVVASGMSAEQYERWKQNLKIAQEDRELAAKIQRE